MRWGLLFRSDDLHQLDREDLEAFEALGLRTVFDLRSAGERDDAEDRLPPQTALLLLPTSQSSTASSEPLSMYAP